MKIYFSLLLLLTSFIFAFQKAKHTPTNPVLNTSKIIGQNAPNDMVFIPGEKHIESFYMSVSEEPNINYLIYLKWLISVYSESYPEVVERAIPTKHKPISLYKFNDPYVNSYLTHPAFSYYPVTGLSWIQIQEYLIWKTDRMNEAILIENGFLNFNPSQKDEDSFNTESYLCSQYQGDVRKNLRDEATGGERSIKFNDGILMPGFRLPTEAEWEYANQDKFKKEIDKKRCLKPFSENAINHPYGQNHYTLSWDRVLENSYSDFSQYDDIIKVDPNHSKGFEYVPDENDRAGKPQRLTSIGDYNPKEFGLINMEGNVKEWLMDIYEEEPNTEVQNLIQTFEKNGFKTKNAEQKDLNGMHIEKDFLGRMKHFRYLGINSDGTPLAIGLYSSEYENSIRNKNELEERKSFINERLSKLKSSLIDWDSNRETIKTRILILKNHLKYELTEKEKQKISRSKERNYYARMGDYMWKYHLVKNQKILNDLNPKYLQNDLQKIEKNLVDIENYLQENAPPKRVVKGGTWQNSGNLRTGLFENQSDAEVGFRCVLPYLGMPIKNKYKVKWQR